MADTSPEDLNEAKQILDLIRQMMDDHKWHYDLEEDKLAVITTFGGEDLPMKFSFIVAAGLKVVVLTSWMPFSFKPEKTTDIALACNKINSSIAFGRFSADLSDNTIEFRLSTNYNNSMLSKDVFDFMLAYGNKMVDDYNDKFMALSNGLIDLDRFYEIVEQH